METSLLHDSSVMQENVPIPETPAEDLHSGTSLLFLCRNHFLPRFGPTRKSDKSG